MNYKWKQIECRLENWLNFSGEREKNECFLASFKQIIDWNHLCPCNFFLSKLKSRTFNEIPHFTVGFCVKVFIGIWWRSAQNRTQMANVQKIKWAECLHTQAYNRVSGGLGWKHERERTWECNREKCYQSEIASPASVILISQLLDNSLSHKFAWVNFLPFIILSLFRLNPSVSSTKWKSKEMEIARHSCNMHRSMHDVTGSQCVASYRSVMDASERMSNNSDRKERGRYSSCAFIECESLNLNENPHLIATSFSFAINTHTQNNNCRFDSV